MGSVVMRCTKYRQPNIDNFHELFTVEGHAPNSNMIFLYRNSHNVIREPFKNHSKLHCNSDNTASKYRMTSFKSNLFIHFGNVNYEYFKQMLNTHRTFHLCTLTALFDKWVHIRRGISPKVNTIEKVGELNWCSPSREV